VSCGPPADADGEDRLTAVLASVWPELRRYLTSRIPDDPGLIEDLMQEAAADLVHKWLTDGELDEDTAIAVLKNSAKHDLLDHWRKRQRRKTDVADIDDELLLAHARRSDDPDDVMQLIARMDLDSVLRLLHHGQREALVLVYLEGVTQREAAEQLGISPSALQRRIQRAFTSLQRHLSHPDVLPPAQEPSSRRGRR
jgi:RNA polymerase sigma factor (sigma-70 family)